MSDYTEYQKVSEDEPPQFTSTGSKCTWKIQCWKCKVWCYTTYDFSGKIHTCLECKQKYSVKKWIERQKKNGTYKELTAEEIEERDKEEW